VLLFDGEQGGALQMQNYSNIQPSYYSSSPPPPVQKKERGMLLTFLLGVSTAWNVLATFIVVFGGAAADNVAQSADDLGTDGVHHVVSRLVAVLAVFQIAQLVSLCGIWAWKRWALLGYFATSIIAMVGSMRLTGETPYWSMVSSALVLLAILPRLGMFED
jgi:hypothetical protein